MNINNPLDLIMAIKNPKQFVINYATNNSNPILSNLIQMAQKGDQKGIEEFAKNLYKTQGRDFDKEYSELMQMMKK